MEIYLKKNIFLSQEKISRSGGLTLKIRVVSSREEIFTLNIKEIKDSAPGFQAFKQGYFFIGRELSKG